MASWLGPVLKAIGIGTATNVLSSKILGTDEQKAQIGSGTAPSLQAGPPIEMTPIEGSVRQDFGDFGSENLAESPQDEQDRLMELILMEQMKDDEGVASLYNGGYLNRNGGGSLGIMDLIKQEVFNPQELMQDLPEVPLSKIQTWWQSLDPEVQDALMAGGEKVGSALFERTIAGKREQPGSLVSTQTLPGNSARRRATQMSNIKPVGGSELDLEKLMKKYVDFSKSKEKTQGTPLLHKFPGKDDLKFVSARGGGVLDRRMFAQNYMPDGGDITGPGGPKDDLIPVMASNGEYMLSKAAVDQAGGGNHAKGVATLEAFNELGNMRYG